MLLGFAGLRVLYNPNLYGPMHVSVRLSTDRRYDPAMLGFLALRMKRCAVLTWCRLHNFKTPIVSETLVGVELE